VHATSALSDRVLTVHDDGKVSLVSSGLEVLASQPALRSSGTVLESWVFPTETCGFVSSVVGDAVVLVLGKTEDTTWICAVSVSEDALAVIGDVELAGVQASVSR
jgi:hypothetical protein